MKSPRRQIVLWLFTLLAVMIVAPLWAADAPVTTAPSGGEPEASLTERGIKGAHGYMTEFVVDDERYIVKVPKELRELAVLIEPLKQVDPQGGYRDRVKIRKGKPL